MVCMVQLDTYDNFTDVTLANHSGSHSLLKATFKLLKWPLLKIVPPRVALIALNFSQPFLIHRAITLSQESIDPHNTDIGYGLIGAYVFVYVGIAVGFINLSYA
jgi:ATP-binding cassette, subfamily C (CFTR/MRP), member 1